MEKVTKQEREKECRGQNCHLKMDGERQGKNASFRDLRSFESQLHHALTTEPWAKDLASLSLPVLACEEAAVRRAWLVWAGSLDKGL